MKWDMATNTGNPTKSVIVNKLIKIVKQHEVRTQGKPLQALHAMELGEFNVFIRGMILGIQGIMLALLIFFFNSL